MLAFVEEGEEMKKCNFFPFLSLKLNLLDYYCRNYNHVLIMVYTCFLLRKSNASVSLVSLLVSEGLFLFISHPD